jgi:hypothetical protein
MGTKLNGNASKELLAKVRSGLIKGLDDEALSSTYGLPIEDVEQLKEKLIQHDADLVKTRPVEQTYVRYVIEQRQGLDKLDKVLENVVPNSPTYVAAIRARSEIIRDILKTGVELGVVERSHTGTGFVPGEAFRSMGRQELHQYIINEINIFNDHLMRFGDQKLLDLTPGPIYRSLPAERVINDKVKPHTRSPVHGGRSRTRGREISGGTVPPENSSGNNDGAPA